MRERFPYIPSAMLDYEVEFSKYKTERGLMNHLADVNEDCKRIVEQPDVKYITMSVEWRKSSMWGMNPHLDGRIETVNGRWDYEH